MIAYVCVSYNLSFELDNLTCLLYSAVDLRRHIACEVCDPSVSGGYDPLLNQVAIFEVQLYILCSNHFIYIKPISICFIRYKATCRHHCQLS